MDKLRDDYTDNTRENLVPAEAVEGHHDADGTMGEVAGTGAGAISGGVVGAAVGGPVGAVIGAVAGGVLGAAGGEAAHKIGDDHDDVNVSTDSEGSLGRASGAGAGAISGAVVGTAAGGPVGTVAGAVAGGMLGAAAGDAAKHAGEDNINRHVAAHHDHEVVVGHDTNIGTVGPAGTLREGDIGNDVPGIQTGGTTTQGPDTRGLTEKATDTITGDRIDDKTGGRTF